MHQNVTLVIEPCNFHVLPVYITVILVQLVSHWSAVSLTSTYGIPIPFYVLPGVQG